LVSSFPATSDDFRDIFKCDSIAIDDDDFDDDNEMKTINPDAFLNEDFFLKSFRCEFEKAEKSESSESSGSTSSYEYITHEKNLQLTPPISPHDLDVTIIDNTCYQNFHLISNINQQQQQLHYNSGLLQNVQERKIKPIVPKPSLSSSDSENPQKTPASEVSSKTTSPVDKLMIKQQRLIRNRESALQSRRKKKEYVQTLEVELNSLRKDINSLRAENSLLKTRLMSCRCESSFTSKMPTKNASLLFALILMVGFNFVSIGNVLNSSRNYVRTITQPAQHANVEFNTRHLLFVDDSINMNNNSSFIKRNASEDYEIETELPIYFNQSYSIRKNNVENIRNWLRQPNLFNVSHKDFNNFEFDDPTNKLARMHEKSREFSDQMMNHLKGAKKMKLPKKKVAIKNSNNNNSKDKDLPVQLTYDSSFFKLHEFFEEINRKEDTFYLFSLKADHLLLPADYPQNFSQIIKMNLIMPRSNNGN
jgi:hypothetical protein